MADDLAALLAGYAPFDSLDPEALAKVAESASVVRFERGELVLDAFAGGTDDVFLVVAGRVDLWNNVDLLTGPPDEILGPGGVFGFSAMLTEGSVGPRATAAESSTVARMPGSAVTPAFASRRGARFLAERVSAANRRAEPTPTYSLVDELILSEPVLVEESTTAVQVARLMGERGSGYAALRRPDGRYGLVTDEVLRRELVVAGRSPSTPAGELVEEPAPAATLGDSAAEALIQLLDTGTRYLLVTDRAGELRGVVEPGDFAVSPTTAGVAMHEQLRRAETVEQLAERARRVPGVLADLLRRGLASSKVIAVYSAILDTVVRRAVALVFERHPELSVDAFTWLSLGSVGRREAVLSSDVDSAVAFADGTPSAEADAYRAAFAEVGELLATCGISGDAHGATAQQRLFARTNAEWRAAAGKWLAAPEQDKGAIMTSLLVDGRPIHGDPGLPAAAKVFSDLRRHPGTMRLLLQESLSRRAKMPARGILSRRSGVFDVKEDAVLPIVNLARWAALSVGSAALPTTERLRAAAGSEMLPQDQAETLVEVFEVLQRLRLRYQVLQYQRGEAATDRLQMDEVSPLDRSVIAQAVREVAAVQRRMDNVSLYVPAESWASPRGS
ncbi:putative nucleotidyltransferase substrate binding domain-containing protein [uncultured Friedmanniella sp.]|uniref:putative nucleotidyltransferase substrate binding domain-containing protein n=1 Tax=uncultured Friedmanniella sp. TaxID=335381 RepID=UPI0035CBDF31